MRIIAGRLGGRNFDAPKGHRTHPMSEKARGALFNALGDISDLTVLDAFSGSGALSFEAISRGAANATAIDIDKDAFQTIRRNTQNLKLDDQIKAIRANASGWSDNNPDRKFDLLLLAPPYDDLQPVLIQKLTKHLSHDGLCVVDWPGNLPAPKIEALKIIDQKNYGDAQLVFYRQKS